MEHAQVSYRLEEISSSKYSLGIRVDSAAGTRLKKLRLGLENFSADSIVEIRRRGLEDLGYGVNPKDHILSAKPKANGLVEVMLDDHLFSKRRFKSKRVAELVPATYVYEIEVKGEGRIKEVRRLRAFNSLTAVEATVVKDPALEISANHQKNSVWWDPEEFYAPKPMRLGGKRVIKSDLILEPRRSLILEPGAEILLEGGVSILINSGKFLALGTPEKPIVIASAEKDPWGSIAVQSGEIELGHVKLEGGHEDHLNFVHYHGSLSLHNTIGSIRDSEFESARVSARGSDLDLERVNYSSIFDSLIQAEGGETRLADVVSLEQEVVHDTISLLEGKAHGTPRRTEREFKFSLSGPGVEKHSLDWISKQIYKALNKSLDQSKAWTINNLLENNYYHDKAVKDFVFRDIYFDTPDDLAYQHQISYRLRNRYFSLKDYNYHLKDQNLSDYWPYRLEYQAKFNRKELGGGFSTVDETRFEFRKESKPFSETYLPPNAPWNLAEFLPYFQAGRYKGLNSLPAKDVITYLNELYPDRASYQFDPSLVLLTERFRQHINIKTPWGSGPNPEQAYIISLDSSSVYSAKAYLAYLRSKGLGAKNPFRPDSLGELLEVEIEFERNISDRLDQEIQKAIDSNNKEEQERLEAVRAAFLEDQRKILEVIKEHFKDKNITVQPADKSKYAQAREL